MFYDKTTMEVLFNAQQMRKLMKKDLLVKRMVEHFGNDEEALRIVFNSEVLNDAAMEEAYLNA